ncbi:MAG: hypothetical protein HY661_03575, partial [Betaproteobacteria bacterium]|nr:hypothetical protein [Betaproteobacteria bacterium]
MKFKLGRWGLAALIVGTLAACGGGGGGGDGTTAATGGAAPGGGAAVAVAPPTGPVIDATTLTSTQFAALAPTGAVTSVAINSPAVVTFQITDSSGRGISGLGFTSKSATALAPSLTNLAFSIAKLVPGTN